VGWPDAERVKKGKENMDEKHIRHVYDELEAMTQLAFQKGHKEITAEINYEHARLTAISEGKITGKNPDERKAATHFLLEEQEAELIMARDDLAHAKHLLAVARLREAKMKAQLRLEELCAMNANAGDPTA
jgi:hypothetical protein